MAAPFTLHHQGKDYHFRQLSLKQFRVEFVDDNNFTTHFSMVMDPQGEWRARGDALPDRIISAEQLFGESIRLHTEL